MINATYEHVSAFFVTTKRSQDLSCGAAHDFNYISGLVHDFISMSLSACICETVRL